MGEFQAGKWLLGLFIYFFFLFVVISQVVVASGHYGINTDARFNDPGFQDFDADIGNTTDASAGDTGSISSVRATLSIITGIGAGSINIGVPAAFVYIFSFLFFWLEFFVLLWALYMSLPFFH